MKQASRALALILGLVSVWGVARADVAATAAPEMDLIDQVTQPVWWFNWGFDTRLRQEYQKNNRDLTSGANDARNVIRWRTRVWSEFGPFLQDDQLGVANGLKTYIRMTYEPRYYQKGTYGVPNSRQFNEVVLDNLYVSWQRMAGLPVGIKAGRQDVAYGRGWVLLDGTPADGGRTTFSDAVKVSLYLNPANTLDLFAIDNKGNNRVDSINDEHRMLSEYDAQLLGAYLISTYFKPHEVHAYYIYKNEHRVMNVPVPSSRTVHMVGALVQGVFGKGFDYYAEAGAQWGREAGNDRQAYGFNSDIGYTFDAAWKPRLHAFYEHLTGDNPRTAQFEGWDPILGRWPQWSEIYATRYGREGGMGANYSNLQRMGAGIKFLPTKRLTAILDYSYLLANHHQFGTNGNFGNGHERGHLVVGKLLYKFTDRLNGHLWAEWLHSGNYYNSAAQDAMFLRWEITYEFKPIVRR